MNPAQLQRKINEGLALHQKGRSAEAAAVFAEVRTHDPKNFDAWHLGGNLALLRGDAASAIELYARATRLNPRSAVAATCLGVARMAAGDFAGAEAPLRAAVKLEPRNAEIWNQLATLLSTAGRSEEALKAHRQAVTLNARSAPAWQGYAATLANLNRAGEALDCANRAVAADSHYLPARRVRAVALQKCHRVPEAIAEYDAILATGPTQSDVLSQRLFALNYVTEDPPVLATAHRSYGDLFRGAPAPSFPNSPDPARKLRVAFFSADFREHSVAYFLEPLLRELPADQFEILLYSTGSQRDAVTARFQALAAVWRECSAELDRVLEPLVRADAPDIAVDLGGHTGHSLLPLFARRLAPVQVSYLGYPNTTGLSEMDYRFVDAITDPLGAADAFHTEKLVRFSPCAWVYAPPDDAPHPSRAPADGVGGVTFGSCNNFSKVTDQQLRLWSRIMAATPDARLLVKSIGLDDAIVRDHVHQRLRTAGIPVERVEIAGATPTTLAHLQTYARVDVALDTAPYNGTTTTCEALWMGVPVIAQLGNRHAARVSASLLHAIGRPEWIAHDADDYVTKAVQLARDPVTLATIRRELRDQVRRSVLLDHSGQSQHFAAALRQCWITWCGSQPNRPIGR